METLFSVLNIKLIGDVRIMHIFLCGIGVVAIRVILSMISELYYIGNNKQNRRL